MPQFASPRFSYISCVREVLPSSSLEEFWVRAQTVSSDIFGLKRGWMVRLPDTREEELRPGHMARYEGASIPNVTVFSLDSLRVTLFERRSVATQESNDAILRAYNRISASYIGGGRKKHTAAGKRYIARRPNPLPEALRDKEISAGVGKSVLEVVARTVVDSTQPDYASAGTEYALMIEPETRSAQVLCDQANIVEDEVHKTVAGQPLFRPGFSSGGNVLYVPFIQIPNGSPDDHHLFLEAMNEGVGVTFQLGQPEWEARTRPPVLEPAE